MSNDFICQRTWQLARARETVMGLEAVYRIKLEARAELWWLIKASQTKDSVANIL